MRHSVSSVRFENITDCNWLPIEVSNYTCTRDKGADDLVLYKNHYIHITKLHTFIGNRGCNFICPHCKTSFTTAAILKEHKVRCEENGPAVFRISKDRFLKWKIYFHKIPLYFRVYADFECNIENIDSYNHDVENEEQTCSQNVEPSRTSNEDRSSSRLANKSVIVYKLNPTCNGYYIVSELYEVLKSGYYESPFREKNVDWLVME